MRAVSWPGFFSVIFIVSNCVPASPVNLGYLTKGLNWFLDSSSFSPNSPATIAGGGKAAVVAELSGSSSEIDVSLGWVDPRILGGRLLDASFTTPHEGEPLNVIISGKSDPYVLSESGFSDYARSLGFSSECLGVHVGHIHQANLGDGNERRDEQILARQYYFMGPAGPIFGTCWESLAGGNHFRAWKQNGTQADSGAWFLGVSKEQHAKKNHMIVPNGYNIGRDFVVEQAVSSPTHWNSLWWRAEVEWVEGLLEPGSVGVNHGIEQDGLVAVLTVSRL
ncbi:hypothetical protein GYMLUDRAFT_212647 [Collybiopsis luxurians FD-317 M1]|nr:hypothetical protein GYMLUDRAFT_212647 [Collybiopsis luxurians FD-317 M1]